MTDIIRSDADDSIARATAVLDEGLLVVAPTDTLYALAADALNEEAVHEVFRVKQRGADQALPVCVSGFEDLGHVAQATPLARRLAEAFWPGALTIVMRAKPWLPEAVTAGGETVAVRAPDHAYARALASRFGPYTVTSANRHGAPPAADVASARAQLGADVRLYVDGGTLLGRPSTIVDCTGTEARLIREGAIPSAKVLSVAAATR